MKKQRPLGNPITKALAAGKAAGEQRLTADANPYQRKPQHDAWERARRREAEAHQSAQRD